MAKPARRHHLVSKFYLRHFADENDQVRTVELPGAKRFTQSVNDASVHTDFFTLTDDSGPPSDALENAFGAVEAAAAEAWRAAAAGEWPLPEEHRQSMAEWIAVHLLRTASNRNAMTEMGNRGLRLQMSVGGRKALREHLKAIGAPHEQVDVDEMWVSLFAEPPQVQINADHHAAQIATTLPKVTASILARIWVLTRFDRKALATSDHPVVVVPNPEMTAVGMGTGILNAKEIALPLTRRLHLGLALRTGELANAAHDIEIRGVSLVAQYCNSVTSRNATRFIYHHPDDNPLDGHDLPPPRTREMHWSGTAWQFMLPEDRQMLLDAGLTEPED